MRLSLEKSAALAFNQTVAPPESAASLLLIGVTFGNGPHNTVRESMHAHCDDNDDDNDEVGSCVFVSPCCCKRPNYMGV